MKTRLLCVLAAVMLLLLVTSAFAHAGTKSELVVTTDWLAAHLNDRKLVLLHVDWNNGGYRREHIPGALFLWINDLAKDTPELSTELPSIKEVTSVLRKLGLTKQSRIVVYFVGHNVTMTTRMIMTLAYFGLDDSVSLLDGGLDAWKSEGRPLSKEVPEVNPSTFVPTLHPEVVADARWISSHLTDSHVTIVDARAKQFYNGTAGTNRGHIPHAVNLPYSSVLDSTNRLPPPDSLRRLFTEAGVKQGTQIVTYCHVGQQATLVYFVARYLGYDARVYDGSFQDWSDRGLPIENPLERK